MSDHKEQDEREFHLQYVPHSRRAAFERIGWREVRGGGMGHHYCYAILMRWNGEGDPKQPGGQ